ncbi:hypothetical protein OROMI_031284 [Orobanche minor]
MIKPTTVMLVITLTASLAWPMELSRDSQEPKVRDAITLSIQENRAITKFVKTIPRLEIMHARSQQTPELERCVDRLVLDLESTRSTLHRLKHLKHTNLSSDADWLKRETTRIVSLSKTCSELFGTVDAIVLSTLTRKLEGLSLIVDDVVRLVSEMEQDVYSGETKVVNP